MLAPRTHGPRAEEWVTVREAAVRCSLTYHQIMALVDRGILVSRRSATGRWYIATSSVEAYCARRAAGEER